MTILSETRERFLMAIIGQVEPERIAEIHFFPPIKQGGIESGVAVVAAWPEAWAGAGAARADDVEVADDAGVDAATEAAGPGEEGGNRENRPDPEAPDGEAVVNERQVDQVEHADDVESVDDLAGAQHSESAPAFADAAHSAHADVADAAQSAGNADHVVGERPSVEPSDASSDAPSADATNDAGTSARPRSDARAPVARGQSAASATTRAERHVIYTARYRLVLKGIDRGKWETNVFAEADAPLITVDAVVRGVQRRSGDVDDATRMDGDDVRTFAQTQLAKSTAR